jgi:hypothetical protein
MLSFNILRKYGFFYLISEEGCDCKRSFFVKVMIDKKTFA